MHRTRTRVLIGLGSIIAAFLLTGSAPATATPSASVSSMYCDYLNHVPDVTDR
jgi:hypothetical protein